LVLAALAGSVDPASADPAACAGAIGRASAKYAQAVMRVRQRCEDKKVAGRLPVGTDCATEPRTDGMVQKAKTKLRAAIAQRCGGADRVCGTAGDDPLAAIGWGTGSCPNLEAGACANPISHCGDVATCLACVDEAAVSQATALYYGELVAGEFGTRSALNKCQRAIGTESARFFTAKSRALSRCWDARLKGRHANQCPSPGDGRTAAAIARAEARKRARICAACGGADTQCNGAGDSTPTQIGFVDTCSAVVVPGGASCAGAVGTLTALVDCVDCVTDFKADCVSALAVPTATSYPGECNAPPPTTTTLAVTTTTSGASTTTTVAPCPPSLPVPLGTFSATIGVGTLDCGGQSLNPGPQPPVTGQVTLPDASTRALGLGCEYVGDGNGLVPGLRVPDGFTTILDVSSIDGTAIVVTASNGTGPATCSRGPNSTRHCVNGALGTDGSGSCATDAECGGITQSCAPDTNCYFGPPIPVSLGAVSACIMDAIASDVCAEADLVTLETTLTSALLSARIFLTGDIASPCPRCVAGLCTAGQRSGLSCSGGIGSTQTTIECPPTASTYVGSLEINLSGLTTGTSTLTADANGKFCPGQNAAGAFGTPAESISQTGVGLGGGMTLFDVVLGGAFCVPSSGNGFFDVVAGLPGPAAVAVPATASVCLLPSVCSALCSPCTLGPLLCPLVCAPCNMCP
jgi:hypothetical protein